MNKILLSIVCLLIGGVAFGQTVLSEGDIALVAMSTGDEDFAFVTLVDIDAGTEIYFTDNSGDGDFTIGTSEGTVKYTAPISGITAGTVITGNSAGTATDFSSTTDGSIVLANGGDGILAYQGTSVGNVTTFLHFIGEGSGDFGSYPVGTLDGGNGVDYLLLGADDGSYTSATTSGTQAGLFSAINTIGNWTVSGSASINPPASFTVTTDPFVGFNNNTSSENETDATFTVNIPVTINNYGGSPVDLSVSVNGGTAEAGDYILNTTSLSFTANGTQNISLDINDDADFDDETLELILTEITTTGITISPSIHTVSIDDNDTAPAAPAAVDNFTDGNFTSSPEWTGDVGSYSIVTDGTLPGGTGTDGNYLGSNAGVGKTSLVTSSTNTSEWKFSLGSGDFEPSTANRFGVILMSDVSLSGDITSTSWNGYYVLVGVNTVADRIELWRRSNNSSTKIGDFTTSSYSSSGLSNGVDIKITRSTTGEFELFYADNTFNYAADPTNSAGTFIDNNHTTSAFFGIFTDFANPNTDRRIFIDNINDQTVLPIELTSFTATPNQKSTLLKWQTASELNNDYMAIEHSTDSKTFREIGIVQGAGTTYEQQNYTFVDENPVTGINYYRLRQVDFDGTMEYSKVVSVEFRGNNDDITIYPNPTTDALTIKFPQNWEGDATSIEIYNNLGQLVKVLDAKEEIFSIQDLPNGHYQVRIENGQQSVSKRLQKQ